MPACTMCGDDFTPQFGKGRPRTRCYRCSPVRNEKASTTVELTDDASATYQGGQSHDAGETNSPTTTAPRQQGETIVAGVHCGWCGSFCQPGERFCNPAHRARFTELVADVRSGKKTNRLRDVVKRKKAQDEAKMHNGNVPQRSILQRIRDREEAEVGRSKIKKMQRTPTPR